LETKTFKENPFQAFKLLGLIFFGIIAALTALLALDGFKPWHWEFILAISGALLVSLLISALVINFTSSKRKIVCSGESCEISSGGLFEREFRWSEVSDTNIVEEVQEISTPKRGTLSNYFFEVTVNGQAVRLLNLKQSSPTTTRELIDFVNHASPQVKYVWEKNGDFGNRQSLFEVKGYTKVARTPDP
jgi:hypothetical protein